MASKYQHLGQNYKHKDKTRSEVIRVIQKFRCLDAKEEQFVFTDGRVMNLINLQGTIPVNYKNNTYHIPICIWLMDTHPDNAPMCYVKPTPSMRLNISHHVDHCGKIYAPYLHEWTPNDSNLITLIHVLMSLFSEKPPVYSDPTLASASSATSTPYPIQPSPYYMPMPGPTTALASANCPYPLGPTPGYPPMESAHPPYPVESSMSTPYPGRMGPVQGVSTGTITEQHIHASLLSAAEDKVRRHIREHFAQAKAEMDTLERIQDELVQGKEKLAHLMNKLDYERNDWSKMLTSLRDKELELDTALLNLSKQGELVVDDAVVTTAPLYRQLLNAFAEEAATEDAIYYLGEGLRRGVIDLDVFLKHVRSLSRKQFMLRALMHKCRNKAGLVC